MIIKLIWMLHSTGGYTVKSCSPAVDGLLLPCQKMNTLKVWKPTALPKVEFFTWLAVLDRLNTKVFLQHYGLITAVENACCCCQTEEESLHYPIQHCQQVWTCMVDNRTLKLAGLLQKSKGKLMNQYEN